MLFPLKVLICTLKDLKCKTKILPVVLTFPIIFKDFINILIILLLFWFRFMLDAMENWNPLTGYFGTVTYVVQELLNLPHPAVFVLL